MKKWQYAVYGYMGFGCILSILFVCFLWFPFLFQKFSYIFDVVLLSLLVVNCCLGVLIYVRTERMHR